MEAVLQGLKPESLWRHFDEIRKIPRCSGKEDKIREYVIKFAQSRGLSYRVDSAGNVVIKKKASPGKEKAPGVVLQAHLDMVCEKNSDVDHDFEKDPIKLRREGDWLMAQGTTLGADNGIGVAAALAVLEDDSLVHGPLEVLLTVDEETGLTGAFNLDPSLVEGRILLNLDSEEEGTFFIGCAGGGDSVLRLPVSREGEGKGKALKIKVHGLKGGHSGIDIHLGRGNAIKILARLLYELADQLEFSLVSFNGGNKRNAIPREAEAVIIAEDRGKVEKVVSDVLQQVKDELRASDPGVSISIEEVQEGLPPMTRESRDRLIASLLILPHGVLAMSQEIEGLVETSTNLGVVKTAQDKVEMVESSRSSIKSALEAVRKSIKAFAELVGAEIEQPPSYPGWKPNLNSKVLAVMKRVYKRLFGKEPEVKAIHAGLETGIIGEKIPGMDMISFGPDIRHPHSPDEKVNIPSVEKFWKLLVEALKELAG